MAYDAILAGRVGDALRKVEHVRTVEMMGGLCFMVDGKMCVGVLGAELLVRVGPEAKAEAMKRKGCREMDFTGRPMKAFVIVAPAVLRTGKALQAWIDRALAFNPRAVSTLKRAPAPMPAGVNAALRAKGLLEAYAARPPYQRNDYLRWIGSAKREATRQKRLDVMLKELADGTRYMNMAWSGNTGQAEPEIPADPLARKLGIKDRMRRALVNGPARFHGLAAPAGSRLSGAYDYIHLFTTTPKAFLAAFPKAKQHLRPGGMLWVSWPKDSKARTGLSLPEVIRMGYDFGMVESKCISLDAEWSALKFTFPKSGKEYRNRYGRLKST